MSNQRLIIDVPDARAAIQGVWPEPITDCIAVHEGENSAAFSFRTLEKRYIARFGTKREPYEKDRVAAELVGSDAPVPKVHLIAELGEHRFLCITDATKGSLAYSGSPAWRHKLAQPLLQTLVAIHRTDISATTGFGEWSASSLNAPHSTAREAVASEIAKFKSIAERHHDPAIGRAADGAARLVTCVSNQRCLLHGDYGFNNVVAERGRITGVFDWAGSRFGDPLRDVAWLDWWQDEINYARLFKPMYVATGGDAAHYDERVMLYLYLTAAGSLDYLRWSGGEARRPEYEALLSRVEAREATLAR